MSVPDPTRPGPDVIALLDRIADAVAANPSIDAKREIGLVSEVLGSASWVTGPGDDGAVVDVDGTMVIACGEALFPPFVTADPRGAGIAAVLANVNDVAAMGGIPLGIVDTVVADRVTARLVLEGIRDAAALYRVPVIGGHLTVREGPASVSAFAVGRADALLSSTHAAAGQDLVVAACTQGTMRSDFPFFASFDERGSRLADDVRLLASVARGGLATAAKDISMAGLVGSLAMLLEWAGLGACLELGSLPSPPGVDLALWCNCFPCFGFLLCCDPATTDDCCAVFDQVGLAAARVGTLDTTGTVRLRLGGHERVVLDLRDTPATGLARSQDRAAESTSR
jgi:selenophosphate synthetase-related protein